LFFPHNKKKVQNHSQENAILRAAVKENEKKAIINVNTLRAFVGIYAAFCFTFSFPEPLNQTPESH
jgi:hypothetical protein